jgi:triacylglycerol lipase
MYHVSLPRRLWAASFFLGAFFGLLWLPADARGKSTAPAAAQVSTSGITPHFRNWLVANGYGSFDFARADLAGGSYGGRQNDADTVVNQPVIFIHGNSDKTVGTGVPAETQKRQPAPSRRSVCQSSEA